ncbi:Type 1 glutamine amidotransferase-like domain-containing protein [uncultured Gordonia sp.]|uniref:Type 1 glutamine amidotransferase-like domain-containing protein n=1 Tax=uncultured Gordonia sp. TaxID=198437 RepID=UPI0025893F84|nr:Type 1 glutamine amidotransferase-like domain-containing protein [uncultured Gordonia sp.]
MGAVSAGSVTTVNLLLLSLGFGAVPGFLSEATGKALSELQIGYLDDARIPYAGQLGVRAERDRLTAAGYAVVDLSAVRQNLEEFATTLDRVDAVYVAGGNTFALLWALRRAGAGDLLAERVRASLPYIGCSAGAVVVGPTIAPVEGLDDPAEAPGPVDPRGLELIDTVVLPHADGQFPVYPADVIESVRRKYESRHRVTPLADHQALLVRGEQQTVVASDY